MRSLFMLVTPPRSAFLVASLIATPLLAQTAPRPLPPTAPVAPIAPLSPPSPAPASAAFGWIDTESAREAARDAARDAALDAADRARDVALDMAESPVHVNVDYDFTPIGTATAFAMPPMSFDIRYGSLRTTPRAPWAQGDPADSLYRLARESLNAGEYRRAAQLFAQITRQYPTSQYRADAAYWRAFALYRIGGIADLHEALQALDSAAMSTGTGNATASGIATSVSTATAVRDGIRATTIVSGRQRRSDGEAAILATRIRGALAARGDAAAAAQIARTADGSATSCDDEDAQLRVEALNALVQMDPKNAEPAITKVLARRDPCSAPLRQGAIALVARTNDAHSTDVLVNTARTDPAIEVRAEAIRWLGRVPDDRATKVLIEFATTPSDKSSLQRIAVRSLAAQQSPAARQAIRALMTRTDLPSDVRITALHYAGQNDLQIAELAKMYDTSTDRATREEIVSLLERRDDPQAADKLIDIARTSTDPTMRRRAITALSRKKDPRTTKLLMDILDK